MKGPSRLLQILLGVVGIGFALSFFLDHFLYMEAPYCRLPIPKGAVLSELPRPGVLGCRRVRAGALLCDPPTVLQSAAGGDEKNVHCQASWLPVFVNVLYTKPRWFDCHPADRGLLCEPTAGQEETARRNAKEWQGRKDKVERERYEKCQRGGPPAQKKEAPSAIGVGNDC